MVECAKSVECAELAVGWLGGKQAVLLTCTSSIMTTPRTGQCTWFAYCRSVAVRRWP
jgi:hypothetical protein